MKTKRRNYWSFFWRVGAGFLAFWLAVMAGFTLLLGWQTAQEMHTVMTENLKHFYNDWLQEQLHWYKTDEFGRSLKEFLDRPFANDIYIWMIMSARPLQKPLCCQRTMKYCRTTPVGCGPSRLMSHSKPTRW